MSEFVFSALSIKFDSRKFVMVVIGFGDRLIYFYNQKIKEILLFISQSINYFVYFPINQSIPLFAIINQTKVICIT